MVISDCRSEKLPFHFYTLPIFTRNHFGMVMLLLLFRDFISFRAVLGSKQNWEEGREISMYPLPPHRASPMANIPHQSGTHVTINGIALTHHDYCPEYVVYTGLTLGAAYSVASDTCIMTCFYHHSIVQGIFTALKVPWAPAVHPCPAPNPWLPLTFLLCPLWCLSQNTIGLESNNMSPPWVGFFHFVICVPGPPMSSRGWMAHHSFALNNITNGPQCIYPFAYWRTAQFLGSVGN